MNPDIFSLEAVQADLEKLRTSDPKLYDQMIKDLLLVARELAKDIKTGNPG